MSYIALIDQTVSQDGHVETMVYEQQENWIYTKQRCVGEKSSQNEQENRRSVHEFTNKEGGNLHNKLLIIQQSKLSNYHHKKELIIHKN